MERSHDNSQGLFTHSGKFVRYLDILTNNTSTAISGTFYSIGYTGSNGTPVLITAPTNTSNQYVVLNQGSAACCALGVVMQGATYSDPVTYTSFEGTYLYYGWNATIQPGQTVAFLHYGIQDRGTNTDAVASEAKALVSLSDADALTGISTSERSAIVNFVVP